MVCVSVEFGCVTVIGIVYSVVQFALVQFVLHAKFTLNELPEQVHVAVRSSPIATEYAVLASNFTGQSVVSARVHVCALQSPLLHTVMAPPLLTS